MSRWTRWQLGWGLLACVGSSLVLAHDTSELAEVEVRGRSDQLNGIAASGSEGMVSGLCLNAVPMLRPGEALESVPGLIVTQHAGDGKANQYFLRGFNLDHGSDFGITIAGIPVNMPTHAHGQGYTDLNFLIPELVDRVTYRKGPYFAEEGDFTSAGAAHIDYLRQLPQGLGQLTLGARGYARTLLADSPHLGNGHLLYALELFHNDGPWTVAQNYRKLNGVMRYSEGTRDDGWSLTAMAYRGAWTSTDQVPARALAGGALPRFGSLDPTSGGETERYSLSGEWAQREGERQRRLNLWALQSSLDLWSNFQYCLNNGCPPGDQFRQSERRQAAGFAWSQETVGEWAGFETINRFGLQGRVDVLRPVGLYASRQRQTLATVREDRVTQRSFGLWGQNETRWTDWLRTIQGVRADIYDFAVNSSLAVNSGRRSDALLTPKFSLILGPWAGSELYLNWGQGFHSNDARGTTIRVDPLNGAPVAAVSPLVRTRGLELGLRSEIRAGWQSTVALWRLDADSELIFVGDAGTTEASRPSRRWGIEWTNQLLLAAGVQLDADLSWSRARFRDADPAGHFVPGAVTATANVGLTLDAGGDWFGALRWRYFAPRPLVEDDSVYSKASSLLNLRLGYRVDRRTQLALDVFNLLDSRMNDIEYWYESRLPGEAAAVADRHLHPAEPRTLRVSLQYRF